MFEAQAFIPLSSFLEGFAKRQYEERVEMLPTKNEVYLVGQRP